MINKYFYLFPKVASEFPSWAQTEVFEKISSPISDVCIGINLSTLFYSSSPSLSSSSSSSSSQSSSSATLHWWRLAIWSFFTPAKYWAVRVLHHEIPLIATFFAQKSEWKKFYSLLWNNFLSKVLFILLMLRNWTQVQVFFTLALQVTLLTNNKSGMMNKLTDAAYSERFIGFLVKIVDF